MTDAEAAAIRNKIVKRLEQEVGAEAARINPVLFNMENSAAAILAAAIFIGP